MIAVHYKTAFPIKTHRGVLTPSGRDRPLYPEASHANFITRKRNRYSPAASAGRPKMPRLTAGKKLRTEDLGAGVTLPPSELASLGSKKIINSDELKEFENLKRRAVRLLELNGVRFLGGYGLPDGVAPGGCLPALEDIKRKFEISVLPLSRPTTRISMLGSTNGLTLNGVRQY